MGGWLWRCVRLGPSARAVQGTEQAAAPMTQRQGIKPFCLEMFDQKKPRFRGWGGPRAFSARGTQPVGCCGAGLELQAINETSQPSQI